VSQDTKRAKLEKKLGGPSLKDNLFRGTAEDKKSRSQVGSGIRANEQPKDKGKGRRATTEQPKDKGIRANEQPKDKGKGRRATTEQPKDKGIRASTQPKDKGSRVSEGGGKDKGITAGATKQSKDKGSASSQPKNKERASSQPKDKGRTASTQPKDKGSRVSEGGGKDKGITAGATKQSKDKGSASSQPKNKGSASSQPKNKESASSQPKDKGSRVSEGGGEDKGRRATTEQPKDKGRTTKQPKDKGRRATTEQPKDKVRTTKQPKDKGRRATTEQPKDKVRTTKQPKDKGSASSQPKNKERASSQPKDKGIRATEQPKDKVSTTEQAKDNNKGVKRVPSERPSHDKVDIKPLQSSSQLPEVSLAKPSAGVDIDLRQDTKRAKLEKKLGGPSLKDNLFRGTAEDKKSRSRVGSVRTTKQPKDKFKRVSMIPLGPSHKKLNKGYLSNPKAFIQERFKILVPDALQRVEPKPAVAERLKNLVPDTYKRPEPAWENFNKSFYRLLGSSEKIMSTLNIAPREEVLYDPIRGTKIGDRKYFPAVSTEWKNTIYEYNRNNVLKNLPAFDLIINKLIRHYFKLHFNNKLTHDKYYTRRKRLLFLNKIYTSKAEIKHTNTKVVVTVYLYNREKSVLFKKIRNLQDDYKQIFNNLLFSKIFEKNFNLLSFGRSQNVSGSVAPLVQDSLAVLAPQKGGGENFLGYSTSFIPEARESFFGAPAHETSCFASEARWGTQILRNKFKLKFPWSLKLYKYFWSLITKFKNNHITYEDLKKKIDLFLCLDKLGGKSSSGTGKNSRQKFLKALAGCARFVSAGGDGFARESSQFKSNQVFLNDFGGRARALHPKVVSYPKSCWNNRAPEGGTHSLVGSGFSPCASNAIEEEKLRGGWNQAGVDLFEELNSLAVGRSRSATENLKLFYNKYLMKEIALFEGKSNQISTYYKLLQDTSRDSKSRTRLEYLEKEDLEREQEDLKQNLQAKEELLKYLILNLRLFRKLKLNFHLNKSKFEEKLLYRLKNLIIQYYNKKVEFNFVNLKSLIFNSDLFTYILTLKLTKEKKMPRIVRLMKFILNKAKMPEIVNNEYHKNWESDLAPGGKNIKLRLLNNNKSLETKLSFILGRNYTSLSKLLNMLYFNASAIYGGREAPLPQPLASSAVFPPAGSEINSFSSLLRVGEKQKKSMRDTFRTRYAGSLASEIFSGIEPSEESFVCGQALEAADDYSMRISWANYKRTWSETSAYALNYFIFNSINYKNMGGVRLEVSGRLTKRYRADRAIYKMLWKGGLNNIDSSFQGKSSVVFRGFRDSNVQYSWFKSKRRIGSFAVKGWAASR
jgi:hypothetical protein